MRPLKLILVLCPDHNELGITMFAISVHRFRVVGANTIDEANAIFKEHWVDCVVAAKIEDLVTPINVPFVIKGEMNMRDLIDKIRDVSALKRGPKPGGLVEHEQKLVDSCSAIVHNGME